MGMRAGQFQIILCVYYCIAQCHLSVKHFVESAREPSRRSWASRWVDGSRQVALWWRTELMRVFATDDPENQRVRVAGNPVKHQGRTRLPPRFLGRDRYIGDRFLGRGKPRYVGGTRERLGEEKNQGAVVWRPKTGANSRGRKTARRCRCLRADGGWLARVRNTLFHTQGRD